MHDLESNLLKGHKNALKHCIFNKNKNMAKNECSNNTSENGFNQISWETIRKNLRFNTVSPGLVDTPLTSNITSNDIILQASKKMLALQRIGQPKDISNMIKFLIRKENNWITGQNFIVDGGLSSTKQDKP